KDSVTQGKHIPQAIDLEWRAIGAHQRLNESACSRVVNVDESVTEIADPEFAFHESESPRGIEIAVRDQTPEEVAAGVEHIDEAKSRPGNVIVFSVILLGVSHKYFAIKIADAERRVTLRKVRVDKPVWSHLVKTLIVGFNVARMKIRHVQEIVTIG